MSRSSPDDTVNHYLHPLRRSLHDTTQSQAREREVVASYLIPVVLSSHCLKSLHWTIWVALCRLYQRSACACLLDAILYQRCVHASWRCRSGLFYCVSFTLHGLLRDVKQTWQDVV